MSDLQIQKSKKFHRTQLSPRANLMRANLRISASALIWCRSNLMFYSKYVFTINTSNFRYGHRFWFLLGGRHVFWVFIYCMKRVFHIKFVCIFLWNYFWPIVGTIVGLIMVGIRSNALWCIAIDGVGSWYFAYFLSEFTWLLAFNIVLLSNVLKVQLIG